MKTQDKNPLYSAWRQLLSEHAQVYMVYTQLLFRVGRVLWGTGHSNWLIIPRLIQCRAVLLLETEPPYFSSNLRSAPLPRSWGLLNQLQRVIKRLRCFVFFSVPFPFMFIFFPPVLHVSFSASDALFSFLCLLPLKLSSSTSLSLLSSAASFPLSFSFSFCLHRRLCCLSLSGSLILPGGKMNVLRAAGWRHWPGSLACHWSLYLAPLGKCCGINGGCTLVPIVDRLLAPALCNLPQRLWATSAPSRIREGSVLGLPLRLISHMILVWL